MVLKKLWLSLFAVLFCFTLIAPGAFAQSSSASGPLNKSAQAQGLWNAGGQVVYGSIKQVKIGTPAAPTVVTFGAAGSTARYYFCAAIDMNFVQATGVGSTIPSTGYDLTTGNATLSATNYNSITCAGQAGALGYEVLESASGSVTTGSTIVVGICNANSSVGPTAVGQGCTVFDKGASYTAGVVNTVDLTGPSGNVGNYNNIYEERQAGCATNGTAAVPCFNPTVTLPAGFGDGLFSVTCGCIGQMNSATVVPGPVLTAAPTISAGSYISMKVQSSSLGLSAATGACTVESCVFVHDSL